MADDHGVHGKGHAPGYVIAESREGEFEEIRKEDFISVKKHGQPKFHTLTEGRYRKTADQFDHPGDGGGKRHARSPHLGCAEKAENEYRIQKDIQGKGQGV